MKEKFPPLSQIVFARICVLVLSLCVFGVRISAQDFKTLYDGVEYAQVKHMIGDDPVKINLLRLDLTKVRLDVHHAMDAAIGTEKTSSIATRHSGVAAINAGFFRLDNSIFAGDAAGLLMIDGKLLSEPTSERIALVIFNSKSRTEAAFDKFNYEGYLSYGKNSKIMIEGTNRERKNSDDLIIFSPEFHRTTLANPNGSEVQFTRDRVSKLAKIRGRTLIPDDGFVLSASGKFLDNLSKLRMREKVMLISRPIPVDGFVDISFIEDAVAGVPQLIKNGKIDITWEIEKANKSFVETRHPRTAVAKLKDGKFLMITVDGRQPGVSVGMNLNELASYILELGATDAMNLDGGGSTTMFLDGKVVNKPSDKDGERKVGDAILVSLRKKR